MLLTFDPLTFFGTSTLPLPGDTSHSSCPYSTCGIDVVITHSRPTLSLARSNDVIETVTAAAERHLQKAERKKLQRDGIDDDDDAHTSAVSGDTIIGDLVNKGIVLLPMAIDPHGRLGPMAENFLFNHTPRKHIMFNEAKYPNASTMYRLATQAPAPTGIVHTANARWRRTEQNNPTSSMANHTLPPHHVNTLSNNLV